MVLTFKFEDVRLLLIRIARFWEKIEIICGNRVIFIEKENFIYVRSRKRRCYLKKSLTRQRNLKQLNFNDDGQGSITFFTMSCVCRFDKQRVPIIVEICFN